MSVFGSAIRRADEVEERKEDKIEVYYKDKYGSQDIIEEIGEDSKYLIHINGTTPLVYFLKSTDVSVEHVQIMYEDTLGKNRYIDVWDSDARWTRFLLSSGGMKKEGVVAVVSFDLTVDYNSGMGGEDGIKWTVPMLRKEAKHVMRILEKYIKFNKDFIESPEMGRPRCSPKDLSDCDAKVFAVKR